jgi:DNA-binding NarL/FixJ family response regulator
VTDTIIIAEDNPRDREFLENTFSGYDIAVATNGLEALELLKRQQHPWLISDLQMPGMTGIELARNLWAEQPSARIVFWSQHKDEIYVRSLIDIIPEETVYGYVLKNNESDVLHEATRTVFHECQCWVDPKIHPVQARIHNTDHDISDLEYEVLIDIALGLTDNIIGKRRFLSRRGVQNRLKSLYEKLGIDQEKFNHNDPSETLNMRARAVSVALRRGLINNFLIEEEEKNLQQWLTTNRSRP